MGCAQSTTHHVDGPNAKHYYLWLDRLTRSGHNTQTIIDPRNIRLMIGKPTVEILFSRTTTYKYLSAPKSNTIITPQELESDPDFQWFATIPMCINGTLMYGLFCELCGNIVMTSDTKCATCYHRRRAKNNAVLWLSVCRKLLNYDCIRVILMLTVTET